jgi:hypothetical protein
MYRSAKLRYFALKDFTGAVIAGSTDARNGGYSVEELSLAVVVKS